MTTRSILFATLAFFAAIAACSGSSSSGSSCTDTFNSVCERACACGGASNCTLVVVTDAGDGTSISWASLSECESLYDYGCSMPGGGVRANFDFAACATAIEAAACVTSSMGTKGVAYPAVCNPNSIDAGG